MKLKASRALPRRPRQKPSAEATIAIWSFGTSWVLFKALSLAGIYRSKPEDELRGLDLPEMGTHAYPVEDMPSERGLEPGTFIPAPSGGG